MGLGILMSSSITRCFSGAGVLRRLFPGNEKVDQGDGTNDVRIKMKEIALITGVEPSRT